MRCGEVSDKCLHTDLNANTQRERERERERERLTHTHIYRHTYTRTRTRTNTSVRTGHNRQSRMELTTYVYMPSVRLVFLRREIPHSSQNRPAFFLLHKSGNGRIISRDERCCAHSLSRSNAEVPVPPDVRTRAHILARNVVGAERSAGGDNLPAPSCPSKKPSTRTRSAPARRHGGTRARQETLQFAPPQGHAVSEQDAAGTLLETGCAERQALLPCARAPLERHGGRSSRILRQGRDRNVAVAILDRPHRVRCVALGVRACACACASLHDFAARSWKRHFTTNSSSSCETERRNTRRLECLGRGLRAH